MRQICCDNHTKHTSSSPKSQDAPILQDFLKKCKLQISAQNVHIWKSCDDGGGGGDEHEHSFWKYSNWTSSD